MKSNNNTPIFQPNKTRDITGEKFNNLTAINYCYRDNKHKHYWNFRCDCGNEIILRKSSVTSNNTKMCKFCFCKLKSESNKTHGMSNTRLYREWAGMLSRCRNEKSTSFNRYGALGISVCEEWNNFETFKNWSFDNGYSDNLTIDRINNKDGYNPLNCRWATLIQQANNKRTNLFIEFKGEIHTLTEWSRIYNMSKSCLYARYKKNNDPESMFRGYEREVIL